jgi:hypothetical protein
MQLQNLTRRSATGIAFMNRRVKEALWNIYCDIAYCYTYNGTYTVILHPDPFAYSSVALVEKHEIVKYDS